MLFTIGLLVILFVSLVAVALQNRHKIEPEQRSPHRTVVTGYRSDGSPIRTTRLAASTDDTYVSRRDRQGNPPARTETPPARRPPGAVPKEEHPQPRDRPDPRQEERGDVRPRMASQPRRTGGVLFPRPDIQDRPIRRGHEPLFRGSPGDDKRMTEPGKPLFPELDPVDPEPNVNEDLDDEDRPKLDIKVDPYYADPYYGQYGDPPHALTVARDEAAKNQAAESDRRSGHPAPGDREGEGRDNGSGDRPNG